MFGKVTSIALLAKAGKAEQTAERAMAIAQEARTNAARQRQLALRMELEEDADRLEKEAATAMFQFNKALADVTVAIHERDEAQAIFTAADQHIGRVLVYRDSMEDQMKLAMRAAKEARVKIQPTED